MSEKTVQPLSPLVEKGFEKFRSFIAHQFLEQTLWTFAELGIADFLQDENLTADQISDKAGGWNCQLLYRLLRTSVDIDLVQRENEERTSRFILTETGRLLISNDSSHARDMIRFGLSPFCKKASFYLPDLIRQGYSKGTGAEQVYGGGRSFFDYLRENQQKDFLSTFNGTMTAYSSIQALDIASNIDFSSFEIVVDIGGSLGTLLASILQHYQTLKGIVCDLTEVIEQAQTKNIFKEMNVSSDRYQYHSCDMFQSSTIPIGDVYILKHILHDFNDEKSIQILKSISQISSTNSQKITLFIIEVVILSENDLFSNWISHGMDIYMSYFLGSEERTQKQYEDLLEKGGWRFEKLVKLSNGLSVIQAIKRADICENCFG